MQTELEPTLTIELKPFQDDFFYSVEPFPCFAAAWGTGKTMCAIGKGLTLSELYPNNLGLIARKKYTDLRDSTMKDFNRYTGLSVPQTTKEVTCYDSVIMFRHAEELSGLQNVNLGWFYLEQAEEFDSDDQFQMLKGRLRRVLTPSIKVQQEIIDLGFIDYKVGDRVYKTIAQEKIVDNYTALQTPVIQNGKPVIIWDDILNMERELKQLDVAEYALVNILGYPLRQGIIIANKNGHDWRWRTWEKRKKPEYPCFQATSFDNIDNLPISFIHNIKKMEIESPKKYKRLVMNSSDDLDIEGSYYGEVISWLREQKRIKKVLFDKSSPVYTVWDIGYTTAIWFFQMDGTDVVFLRCWEDTKSIEQYAELLKDFKMKYGYNYGGHYAPFDVTSNAVKIIAGKSVLEKARQHGIYFKVLNPETRVLEGIERTRHFLHKCIFDSEECDVGIEALERYHEGKVDRLSTEERTVFTGSPAKGWEAHLCDGMRYASMAVKKIGTDFGSLSLDDIHKLQEQYGYV